MNKNKIKSLLFILVYFLLLQSVYSFIYLKLLSKKELILLLNIFNYVMLFMPLCILLCKSSIKNLAAPQLLVRRYWIPYLIYVVAIVLIRKQVRLGDYYLNIGPFDLLLPKSTSSLFVMVYVEEIFQNLISFLFFIVLPFYTFFLSSYKVMIDKK